MSCHDQVQHPDGRLGQGSHHTSWYLRSSYNIHASEKNLVNCNLCFIRCFNGVSGVMCNVLMVTLSPPPRQMSWGSGPTENLSESLGRARGLEGGVTTGNTGGRGGGDNVTMRDTSRGAHRSECHFIYCRSFFLTNQNQNHGAPGGARDRQALHCNVLVSCSVEILIKIQ